MHTTFTLKSSQFEGPLELLLDLIEARKLSVSEIHLAEVCDLYIAHVQSLPELPMKETAQFILVASTLLLIKSRSLLPSLQLTEDEREGVEELERRLARLAVVRRAAKLLKRDWGVRARILARAAPVRAVYFSPGEVNRTSIAIAAARLLQALPKIDKIAEIAVAPKRALEEIIAEIRLRLTRAVRASFAELTQFANREERIIYFLAMLELVRLGAASVVQEQLFADIIIEIEQQAGIPRYGI